MLRPEQQRISASSVQENVKMHRDDHKDTKTANSIG